MEKRYVYENGIIYVLIPDNNFQTIHRATEDFLRRVVTDNRGGFRKWEQ